MNADKIWALFQVTCYLVSCPVVNRTNRLVGLELLACQQWNQIEVFVFLNIKWQSSILTSHKFLVLSAIFSPQSSSQYFHLRIWLKGILRCIHIYCCLAKFHGQNRVISIGIRANGNFRALTNRKLFEIDFCGRKLMHNTSLKTTLLIQTMVSWLVFFYLTPCQLP